MAGTLSYVATVNSTADASSYTFSGASLGTAAADRLVVLLLTWRSTNTPTVSSVTIGGVTASLVVSQDKYAGIWAASVPTGTTGDIVVTLSAIAVRCVVDIYRGTGLDATATQTAKSTTNPFSAALNVPAGGVALGGGQSSGGTGATWTGLTERTDALYETTMLMSSASGEFATTQTGLSVSANVAGTPLEASYVFAVFGPAAATSNRRRRLICAGAD